MVGEFIEDIVAIGGEIRGRDDQDNYQKSSINWETRLHFNKRDNNNYSDSNWFSPSSQVLIDEK